MFPHLLDAQLDDVCGDDALVDKFLYLLDDQLDVRLQMVDKSPYLLDDELGYGDLIEIL
jgi:hypothetical protein